MQFNSVEDMMKQLQGKAMNKKQFDSELDDELAKMSKECGIDLKDDELEGLDDKSDNDELDDELKALENELDDDDLDDDDEALKTKPPAKQQQPPPKQKAPVKQQQQPAVKQQAPAKQPEVKKPPVKQQAPAMKQPETSATNEDNDIYTEETEGKYHNPKNIKCMSAIEEEKNMCETIINYKKKNKLDFDYWETKITLLEQQETFTATCIENGKLSMKQYKERVETSLAFDKKLLAGIAQDKSLKKCELPQLKKRLEKRIQTMEGELAEEVDEEEQEEETEQQQVNTQQQQQQANTNVESKPQPQQQQQQLKQSTTSTSTSSTTTTTTKSVKPVTKPSPPTTVTSDDLLNILEERFQEYKSAFIYFQQNDLPLQKDETNKNAKIIKAAIDAIKNGQGKNISLDDLPPKVTPEYIWGYSREDRKKKFSEILNFYSTQIKHIANEKDALQKKTEAAMKSGKKIPKKQIEQIKSQVEKYNNDISSLQKRKEQMKKIFQDEWYPCPLLGEKKIKIKVAKTNTHIDENAIVIHVSELTYHSDNLFIEINCTFDDPKKDKIYPVKNHTFNSDVIWNLTPNEFKNVHRKKLEMKLFKKKFIGSTLITEFSVKLNPLSNKASFKEVVNLKFEKNKNYTVNIDVLVRNPCVEPEIVEQEIAKPAVVKVYPRFQLVVQQKQQQQQPQTQSQAPTQQKPQTQTQAPKPQPKIEDTIDVNAIQIDKSKLTPAELADPYHIDTLNSVAVLNHRLQLIMKKMESIEGRTPKELRDQCVKVKTKKIQLEDALGDKISIEDYIKVLTNQISHDKMLYAHFTKEGMKDKAAIVLGKIKLMANELNEAKSVEA